MTLQQLIDKVKLNPEKYGNGLFFSDDGVPLCPIAKEIVPDLAKSVVTIEEISKRLDDHPEEETILDFIRWWDSKERLIKEGYRL